MLVVFLVVWSATGLLFHIKPGWDRAYDMPSAERRDTRLAVGLYVPPAIVTKQAADVRRVELFDTALGAMYRVTAAERTYLVDAATGLARSPLPVPDAKTLVADAIARSRHRAAYGAMGAVTSDDGTVRVAYEGGVIVEIDRNDARISQRGADTDRIDWLYRIHYLQWSGNKTVDKLLAMAGLALIWAVMIPGIVLFVRRLRAR